MGTASAILGATEQPSSGLTGCYTPDPTEAARLMADIARDLGQRYQVQAFLGRGAFATVWKVYDRITEDTVAVKRFESRIPHIGGFYRELQALLRLRRERIVKLINLTETSAGGRYLILEYCAGGSLRAALGRARQTCLRCPPTRARVLALQLAEGLAVAHRQGLVHRDLKPENILFDYFDERPFGGQAQLKIVDFGLVKALQHPALQPDEPAALRPLSGSPTYMAPEQFDSTFAPASDLYALGVILYELLHGQPPFAGSTEELAYQHLRAVPKIDPALPAPWPALLTLLLAKNPASRCPPSELIEALGRRETDRRAHPARQGAGRFARLRVPTSDLFADPRGAVGVDLVAVAASGLMRFDPETGSVRGQMDLPGLTHAVPGPDGTLWVVQAGRVLRLRSTGEAETVQAAPLQVEAFAACTLPGGLVRLAVVTGNELSDHEPPITGRPCWTLPIRSLGLRPRLVRLGDGRIVVSEGPVKPRLAVVDLDGAVIDAVPLPGPCWALGMWPHRDQIFALLLVNNALRPCRIYLERRQVELLEPVADLALLTCAPAGPHDLFGLCTSGAVVCWRGSGEHEHLFRLDLRDTTFQALATDGVSFGVLCRAQNNWWVQFRTLGAASVGDSR